MQWENSTQGFGVLLTGSENKRTITEACFAFLNGHADTRKTDAWFESASENANDFIAKIDEAFNNLQNISIDTNGLEVFLRNAAENPNPAYVDDKVMFIPSDDVGRINTGYYINALRRMIEEDVLPKIIDGDKTVLQQCVGRNDMLDGIKRQTVNGSYKGNTSKECFSEIPAGQVFDHSPQFINQMILPFVRSYATKKKDIEREVRNVKKMITDAYSMVLAVERAVGSIEDPEIKRTAVLFVSWIAMMTSDVAAFVSYLIIRKIDVMILNVTNVNEMCDNIRSCGRQYMSVESTNPERDMFSGTIDIGVLDNFKGLLSGYYNRLKYAIVNTADGYDSAMTDTMIDIAVERNSVESYPSEHLITAMEVILRRIGLLRKELLMDYPRPLESMDKLNLSKSFIDTFSEELHKSGDIDAYLNYDGRGGDLAFFALGELKRAEEIFDILKEYINSAKDGVDKIRTIQTLSNLGEGGTNDTILEIEEVANTLDSNLGAFVREIFIILDKRYFDIVECVIAKAAPTNIVVPDTVDDTYTQMAMESVLDNEAEFSRQVVDTCRRLYADKKLAAFYHVESCRDVYVEAEANDGNVADRGNGEKEGKGPVVKEDQNKMSDADKAKNAAAVNTAGNKANPSEVKKLLSGIMNGCEDFFNKMINHFQNAMSDKVCEQKMKNFAAAKDAVLARSWGGIELSMRKYTEFSLKQLTADIQSMRTAVSGLNIQGSTTPEQSTSTQSSTAGGASGNASDVGRQLLSKIMEVPSGADIDRLIKGRYQGLADDGTPVKTTYRGAALKKLVSDTMIPFCEEFYGNGRKEIVSALNDLKQATVNKLKALPPESGVNSEDIRACNRSVQMLAGAILTSYRNRGKEYLEALMALVPKNKKIDQASPSVGEDAQTQNADGSAQQ